MVSIKLVQFADESKSLFFVMYEDDSHRFLTLENPDDSYVQQLQMWLNSDNEVGEFVPVISGGIIPLASISWFCGQRPPEGFLLCDGSAVSRSRYVQLFRAIGEIYGSGDGVTTFNLPNLVARFCRGWSSGDTIDEGRQFGSYQEDDVGVHAHQLLPISHTHLINDPGHMHGVTDPGHVHPVSDPGHLHGVTDPGHKHIGSNLSHMGYAGNFLPGFATPALAVTPPFSGQESGRFSLPSGVANTLPNVKSAPANLFLESAQSNVQDEVAVTDISIDVHGINIPYTEVTGDAETRPDNIALLPVIRY
jgi:microcystin-dependent protein